MKSVDGIMYKEMLKQSYNVNKGRRRRIRRRRKVGGSRGRYPNAAVKSIQRQMKNLGVRRKQLGRRLKRIKKR